MIPQASLATLRTPAFVLDLGALRRNRDCLATVAQRSGCRILLALKGFAVPAVFPELRAGLAGVCASSPHEARLGRETFGGEVHAYAPAYSAEDLEQLLPHCDHLVFNSLAQWRRFQPRVAREAPPPSVGLRVNPGHSEAPRPLYDPAAPGSRLGIPPGRLRPGDIEGIEGLHFHALCEQNADALERTLAAFERHYGALLPGLRWVNFGGGHHITRADYEVDRLVRLVRDFAARYRVQVYLEPGEAVAWQAGVLVTTVLDVIENDGAIAILDTSATCHLADVLEMPFRPEVVGAGLPGALPHTYRLGGLSCLAGDWIGAYSFAKPLQPGDRLVLTDMAHYTIVKTNTFNGVRLPDLAVYDPETEEVRLIREAGYADYRDRLMPPRGSE
ncbi:MAG: carboxynorspermidine decarboxylase [Candidatus Marinimicrobia bacterium]|nr:carboxynorspermidine decarboxylase [Candidatus Neomarinimicrobiota bacterium]